MERMTIRADEVRVGDRLVPEYGPDYKAPVSDVFVGVDSVEVFIGGEDYPDPMGPPALTLAPSDQVEVWR